MQTRKPSQNQPNRLSPTAVAVLRSAQKIRQAESRMQAPASMVEGWTLAIFLAVTVAAALLARLHS